VALGLRVILLKSLVLAIARQAVGYKIRRVISGNPDSQTDLSAKAVAGEYKAEWKRRVFI